MTRFPRLAELSDAIQNHAAYKGWFKNLINKVNCSNQSKEWYEQLESELADLSNDAWSSFKCKIVRQVNSTKCELISLLNEVVGYSYLKKMLSEKNIEYDFIREPEGKDVKTATGRKPEWVALHEDTVVAALEVKTLFESDKQHDFINSNTDKLSAGEMPDAKNSRCGISDGLKNKLRDSVEIAKDQLMAVNDNPSVLVAFVIVNVDFEVAQTPDCKSLIEKELHCLCDDRVMVVGDVRSVYL